MQNKSTAKLRRTNKPLKHVLVTLTAIAAIMAMATAAYADRKQGMANNRIVEDRSDSFVFPSLALMYRNFIEAKYGASANSGAGALIIGSDTAAFGIQAHHGEIRSPLADSVNPAFDTIADQPFATNINYPGNGQRSTWVDLMAAFKAGAGAFGVRLGAGGHTDVQTVDGDDTGENSTFISLGGSYSSGEGGNRFDTGLHLIFDLAKQFAAGDDTLTGNQIGINSATRGYVPLGERIDLGYLIDLGVAFTSSTDELATVDASSVAFGLEAGVGPRYRVTETTTIAGYAVIGMRLQSTDPNADADDDEVTQLDIIAPGVRMAFEHALTEWFFFRTGLRYNFEIDRTSGRANTGGGFVDASQMTTGSSFIWNAGIGVKLDAFTIDGAIAHAFMTEGPDFIGGNSSLFGTVTAAYNF